MKNFKVILSTICFLFIGFTTFANSSPINTESISTEILEDGHLPDPMIRYLKINNWWREGNNIKVKVTLTVKNSSRFQDCSNVPISFYYKNGSHAPATLIRCQFSVASYLGAYADLNISQTLTIPIHPNQFCPVPITNDYLCIGAKINDASSVCYRSDLFPIAEKDAYNNWSNFSCVFIGRTQPRHCPTCP